MKIRIETAGDMSVGISGDCVEVDLGYDPNEVYDNQNWREEMRADLVACFEKWIGYGKASVWFDDECPDCGKPGCEGECMTPKMPI